MAADANGDTTMVVEDSEPEREQEQQRQQRRLKGRPPVHWPAPSVDTAASDSDIEIIAGPSTVVKPVKDKTGKKKKKRSNDNNVGGFKSAAAILKEDAKKQSRALLAKQDRKPSIDLESAHNSPLSIANASVHVLEGDDDELFELPPPLSTTLRDIDNEIEEVSILPQENGIACDSPASLFRNNISKFRASSANASTTSSSSLFAPRARPLFAKSTSLSALSDSSSASSSSRAGSSKLARAKSASASTSTSAQQSATLNIPTPYLAIITSCPVCQASWTVSKATSSKSSHITKCATSRSYAPRTVLELVERMVRDMKESVDDERRKMIAEKTLFEDLVSRKGKQVLVVGVEQKNKNTKNAKGKNGSDIENTNPSIDLDEDEDVVDVKGKGKARESTAVLFTQGGSAHSQATSTQVQRELNGKIKVAQKIAKGAYLPNIPVTAAKGKQDEESSTSTSLVGVSMKNLAKDQKTASNGVGSKNWNKAIALLAKSEDTKASASTSSSSSSFFGKDKAGSSAGESERDMQDMALDVPPKKRTGKLRSYSETRFRLSEKAMKIADARTVSIFHNGSDAEGATSAEATAVPSSAINGLDDNKASDSESGNSIISSTSAHSSKKPTCFPRPFRRTDRPSRSLIDQASMLAKDLEYNLWNLAGSEADTVKDRVVDASSPPPTPVSPSNGTQFTIPTISTEPILATATPSSMSAPRPSSPLDNSLSWNNNVLSRTLQFGEDSSSGLFETSAAPPSFPLPRQKSVADQFSSPPSAPRQLSPLARHSSPPPLPPPQQQVQPNQHLPFVSQTSLASQALLDLTSRMRSTKISTALSRARGERTLLHQHQHQQSARDISTSASTSAPREKNLKGKADDEDQLKAESVMEDTQRGLSGNESEGNDLDASATKTKLPKPRKVNYASMLRDAVSAVNKEERRENHLTETAFAIAEKELRKAKRASKKAVGEDELVEKGTESARGEKDDEVETKKRGRSVGSKTQAKNQDAAIMLSDSDLSQDAPKTTITSPSKRKAKDRSTPPAPLSDESSTDDEILKALAEIDGKTAKKSRKKQAGDSPGKATSSSALGSSKQSTLTSTIKTTKKKAASAKVTASDDPPSKAAPGKGKAKAIEKPVPVFDKSKYSLPDYDSWSKEALQAETKKYGYKPSGAKPVLVGQLIRVWRAINPDEAEKMDKAQAAFDRRQQKKVDKASDASSDAESDEGEVTKPKKSKEKKEPALAPWKPRPKPKSVSPAPSRKSSISSSGSSDERPLKEVAAAAKALSNTKAKSTSIKPRKKTTTAASTSSPLPLKRRRPSRSGSLSSSIRTASDQEETLLSESEAEETKTAGERLRAEVLKDQVLYLRLLRYEPICFTVFETMATQAGIKISKVALRDWLDSQAIIFYYPQEVSRNAKRNGAARKRHP